MKSFLFLAVDTREQVLSRTYLAQVTRVTNKLFAMPVILLFRHNTTLTLAAIHRRAHKRDGTLDVLEKVSLIKDICTNKPHRAHLDILANLHLPDLIKSGVSDFDKLHEAWEDVLGVEALNKRFYKRTVRMVRARRRGMQIPPTMVLVTVVIKDM